jgi:hypothetical protein
MLIFHHSPGHGHAPPPPPRMPPPPPARTRSHGVITSLPKLRGAARDTERHKKINWYFYGIRNRLLVLFSFFEHLTNYRYQPVERNSPRLQGPSPRRQHPCHTPPPPTTTHHSHTSTTHHSHTSTTHHSHTSTTHHSHTSTNCLAAASYIAFSLSSCSSSSSR